MSGKYIDTSNAIDITPWLRIVEPGTVVKYWESYYLVMKQEPGEKDCTICALYDESCRDILCADNYLRRVPKDGILQGVIE
jgi:hypothetical protein